MDKLKMHSPDLTAQNIEKIAELFPGCVTEAQDAAGKLRLAIDFDQLRQELSDHIVEGPQERYHLNWPGKREALLTANAPIAKTLRPCREESVDFDTTQNLFIEGDNLEALKLLQETYLGKVKMIYIDPPYNTGNDLIYDDEFSIASAKFLEQSNQEDSFGGKLVINPETNGRFHSDWLSFIYPRIQLSKNFLTESGIIAVSIGESEVHSLRNLLEEVMGRSNFISQITRVAKRTSNKGTYFKPTKDYILIFAKDKSKLEGFGVKKTLNESDYGMTDELGKKYKQSGASLFQPSLDSRPNQRYYIEAPDGSLIIPPGNNFPEAKFDGEKCLPKSNSDKVWRWSVDTYLKNKEKLIFTKGSSRNPLLDQNGNQSNWNIYPKVYLEDDQEETLLPEDIIYDYPNSQGTKELKKLNIPFSFSKPSSLIKYLIEVTNIESGTILDFFAGSGTTADAALQQNATDGKNRKFVMLQLPESIAETSEAKSQGFETIADISKERIRRAGAQILEGECHPDWKKDVGFRVLKIDSSNMADTYYRPDETRQSDLLARADNIKEGRDNPEDLLFQVMLDWAVDLTLPIRRETILGKTVYFVSAAPYDLMACFDDGIDEDLIKELASHAPLRMVFKDTGFATDAAKINAVQIFKQMSENTDVKAI